MDSMKVVRFDQALTGAEKVIESEMTESLDVIVIVRDVYGRIRVAIDDRKAHSSTLKENLVRVTSKLHAALGAYSPGEQSLFLFASEMMAPDEIFSALELTGTNLNRRVRLLDRQLVGTDWNRPPFEGESANRLVLYGIKGGVGRSTAASVLCWKMAQSGKRVLILDLDLESPGLGATLLPEPKEPDYGIVDWFVEDALGQAGDAMLPDMIARSPLGDGGGDVVVVPAGGRFRAEYTYLPKLARCYADVVDSEARLEFGDRLHQLVRSLERMVAPDITILDSRAGLHDIAAIAVTRLNALSLLFAVDSPQTWRAYELLFQGWNSNPSRTARFRENLKMVAAQVPETETVPYLESFREHAYQVFERQLYEESAPDAESTFNFDVKDPEAPHFPLRINWSRSIQQFDPIRKPESITTEQLTAAFGDFVNQTSQMIFGDVAR